MSFYQKIFPVYAIRISSFEVNIRVVDIASVYRVAHDMHRPGRREQVVVAHVIRVAVGIDHVGDVIWSHVLRGQGGDQEESAEEDHGGQDQIKARLATGHL